MLKTGKLIYFPYSACQWRASVHSPWPWLCYCSVFSIPVAYYREQGVIQNKHLPYCTVHTRVEEFLHLNRMAYLLEDTHGIRLDHVLDGPLGYTYGTATRSSYSFWSARIQTKEQRSRKLENGANFRCSNVACWVCCKLWIQCSVFKLSVLLCTVHLITIGLRPTLLHNSLVIL